MYGKGDLGFLQEIEGVKSDPARLRAHEKRRQRQQKAAVDVALTPQVDTAFVTVTPPAYTGMKPTRRRSTSRTCKALAGSDVKFRVQSNRPLAGGSIALQTENAPRRAGGDAPPARRTRSAATFDRGGIGTAEVFARRCGAQSLRCRT